MTEPPGDEKGACRSAPIPKLELKAAYHEVAALQEAVWERERQRLLSEFRKSGQRRHLRAYYVHTAGMKQRDRAA